jgi:hypothetical protein
VDEKTANPAPVGATFVELLAPAISNIAECALEVESHLGTRLRVLMKNVPPAGLACLIRDLAR